MARSTGILVKRIDVNTVPLLRQEMQSSSGKRRLRALAVARVIEVVPQIEDTIIELARQEDHLVRAAAAVALAASDTPAARTLLEEACNDSSLAVQEAALASLAEIDRRARSPRSAVAKKPLALRPPRSSHDRLGRVVGRFRSGPQYGQPLPRQERAVAHGRFVHAAGHRVGGHCRGMVVVTRHAARASSSHE